jgi:hypothetical protein
MTSRKLRARKRQRPIAPPEFTQADLERAGFEPHEVSVLDADGLERRAWIWSHPLGDEVGEKILPGSTAWSARRIASFAFRRTVIREGPAHRTLGRKELSTALRHAAEAQGEES